MKTTVEIGDGLLADAKAAARRRNTTLRALIEQGLRRVLQEEPSQVPFKLRKATFGGKGLSAEFHDEDWPRIRATSYEERGG
jgi:hypothetical protein